LNSQQGTGAGLLDDLLAKIGALEPDRQQTIAQELVAATREQVWFPNPGPQLQAWDCDADELYYGGQAGGGKSELGLGLALCAHRRSLVLRRFNKDVASLVDRCVEIVGDDKGLNRSSPITWRRPDDRMIEFGGVQMEADKERYKGRPHDLKFFDELPDFTEGQYTFIIGWNRSTIPGQRCRVVAAGNPPTRPEGLWVIKRWAAWLDSKHPRPAKPGELRWYSTTDEGEDIEVDVADLLRDEEGIAYTVLDGKRLYCRSRTFIPATLSDNPDLLKTGYQASLDALPAHLRSAYRDGNFHAALRDDDWQLIPTHWITAAQARWKPDGWREHRMTAMGVDPAGGGSDAAEIACRYGGWFAPLVTIKGPETADGSRMAARVIMHRRDNAPVVLDSGGGYGGSYALRLKDNGVDAVAFNGANATAAHTNDSAGLAFVNRRAEAYWRFREALNPDQEGGSIIALPPDDELKADLAAPHWELTRTGIKLEAKEDIRERIGRSPGKADAVCLSLSEGDKAVKRKLRGGGPNAQPPQVNRGFAALKSRGRPR
jgi:hypothetical protein